MQFRFNRAGMEWIAKTGGVSLADFLDTDTLRLYTGSTPWDWLEVAADFINATYTGYSQINLTTAGNLIGPYYDDVRFEAYMKTPMMGFGKCTAAPQTVNGIYLVDTGTLAICYGSAEFDTPVNIQVGTELRVNVLYPIMIGDLLSGIEVDQS